MTTRKPPTCSLCFHEGHTRVSPLCPLNPKKSTKEPDRSSITVDWVPEKELTSDDINTIITTLKSQCNTCNKSVFSKLHEWRGIQECSSCYSKHRGEIADLYKEVYLQKHCSCCGNLPSIEMAATTKYLNMFEQRASIRTMIRRGDAFDVILIEAEKCFTLCNICTQQVSSMNDINGANKRQCYTCKQVIFCELRDWKRVQECPSCYSCHNEEITKIWNSIQINALCNCCGSTFGDSDPFHFDHVNMFEKKDSICLMVGRGDPLCDIIAEVQKCQPLCKSCHAVVTQVETMCGFRRLKHNISRAINGTSVSVHLTSANIVTLQENARRHYDMCIVSLYPVISKLVCSNI